LEFPDLASAGDYLAGLTRHGIHPGLDNIRAVLADAGHPEIAFPAVQITGTNGKGTTAVLVEGALREAGFRTGLYTSPHLLDVRERIRIEGNTIGAELFLECLSETRRLQSSRSIALTFFETLTAIGFMAFKRSAVQVAVLEVGLGGRWDATSVSDPSVTALTSIAKDHTEILGDTLEKILSEKAAIGRPGKPFVATVPAALRPAWDREEASGRFRSVLRGREFDGRWLDAGTLSERSFEFRGKTGSKIFRTSLVAGYQLNNLLTALAILEESPWRVPEPAIRRALLATRNPGRWERIPGPPDVVFDGAHNPESMSALVAQVRDACPDPEKVGFLLGVLQGKDWAEMVPGMPVAGHTFFLTETPGTLSVSTRALGEALRPGNARPDTSPRVESGTFSDMCERAFRWAKDGEGRTLVVTGSFYLIGAVKRWLSGQETPLGAGERNAFIPRVP
jgi:dihydrofolate synthase/folylpolyglutamate synthase